MRAGRLAASAFFRAAFFIKQTKCSKRGQEIIYHFSLLSYKNVDEAIKCARSKMPLGR